MMKLKTGKDRKNKIKKKNQEVENRSGSGDVGFFPNYSLSR